MLNDFLILKKIKEGDIATFERVFKQYYSPLCLYATGITGRKDVAEEIVQELFYIFWKNREEIHILQSLKSYLYGATRNQSLRYCEHCTVQQRHREDEMQKQINLHEPSPLDQLEYKELENIINRTLEKLPERRLKMFRMHRLEGKKYKEIAEYFSVSVKTVEAEMTKAYQVLRQEITKYTQTSL